MSGIASAPNMQCPGQAVKPDRGFGPLDPERVKPCLVDRRLIDGR